MEGPRLSGAPARRAMSVSGAKARIGRQKRHSRPRQGGPMRVFPIEEAVGRLRCRLRWRCALGAAFALLVAGGAAAREYAAGGVRFAVPDDYERTSLTKQESADFVLETVSRVQCAITVTSGYAPDATLVRDFATVWTGVVDPDGTPPEPRRASPKSGGRYLVAEGRVKRPGNSQGVWAHIALVDFNGAQRHGVMAFAATEADIPRCRRDAASVLESLRAEPGWVPPPAPEQADAPSAADEPSVEDLTLLNGRATEVELLWCESKKKQRQRCPADTSAGVVYIGRASFAECEEGTSYWVEDGAITVDRGCRARFAVRAAPGAGARTDRFNCESHLQDSVYCNPYRIDRGVRIGRVLSRAPCVWNESWGVLVDETGVNSYVWVARGCRAEFHRW